MKITDKAKGGGQTVFLVPVSQAQPTVKVNGTPVTVSSYTPGIVTLAVAPVEDDSVEFTLEGAKQGKSYQQARDTLNQASGNQDFLVPIDECTTHQISVDTNGVISAGTVALWGLPLNKSTYEQVFNTDGTPAAISFTLTAGTRKQLVYGRYSSFRMIPAGITGAGTYSVQVNGWSEGNA